MSEIIRTLYRSIPGVLVILAVWWVISIFIGG